MWRRKKFGDSLFASYDNTNRGSMQSTLTQKLVGLESVDEVKCAIRDYRDDLLTAIAEQRIEPTADLMKELAELNVAIGDVEVRDES
jgi:hypothetical protein